jgi:hypothetical protein
MAFTATEYSNEILELTASVRNKETPAAKLLALLDDSKEILFQGKEEIQPIKIYQVGRIYRLARTCIEIITLIWPYIRIILPLLKKIF